MSIDRIEVWSDAVEGGRLSSGYRHAHGNVIALIMECNMLYRSMSIGTYALKVYIDLQTSILSILKHESMSLTCVRVNEPTNL